MIDLAHTQNGLRPCDAPRRNAVDYVERRLARTRPITVALGPAQRLTQHPHEVRIKFRSDGYVSRAQKAEQVVSLLRELTHEWQADINLAAWGFATQTIVDALPDLPRSGIGRIDLHCAMIGAVDTFLTLDGLPATTPPVFNHLEKSGFQCWLKKLRTKRYGPADRPLFQGYIFRHSFWTDIAQPV